MTAGSSGSNHTTAKSAVASMNIVLQSDVVIRVHNSTPNLRIAPMTRHRLFESVQLKSVLYEYHRK